MASKHDERALQSEIERISRRFLAGELSLDGAAREIAQHLPKDEAWALTIDTSDASFHESPEDAARLRTLIDRAAGLWAKMLDDDAD